MKLEIARSLFVFGALVTTTVAVAAWQEPSTQILSAQHGEGLCPLPRIAKTQDVIKPDHDLLLLMYSLAQGTGSKN